MFKTKMKSYDSCTGVEMNSIEIGTDHMPSEPVESPVHEYAQVDTEEAEGWVRPLGEHSLPEYNGLIAVEDRDNASWWKHMKGYVGPGALVAVGYMDPGNWSTDIAGGSAFGYKLLFIVLMSSLIAMFLQVLALRVGLATSRDLAQACRDAYPYPVVLILWVVIEVAICATDVAEVIGSAVAMNMLFGLPLIAGVCITAADVLLVLFLNGKNFRVIEIIVGVLVLLITSCFAVQLGMSKPSAVPLLLGFLPTSELVENKDMLFVAVGIIGATVM